MDVKQYFQQVRELAMELPAEAVVIKSLKTTNGGKAGVLTEVNRPTAAKQIVDGTATLATAEESASYYEDMEIKRQIAERAQAMNRLQISLTTAAKLPPIEVRRAEQAEEE